MFCPRCGSANADNANFCAKCGAPFQTSSETVVPAPAKPTSDVAPKPSAPTGFVPPPMTSGKAVASLLCGFLFFAFPAAILAVILGHLSLSDIRKSAGKLTGHGIAVGGLVLGYLGLCLVPVALIVAAIAIPNLIHSRAAENQAAAVSSLRQIDSAAMSYAATYHNGYPRDLDVLAGLGTQNCDHAGLIDGALAGGFRNGYIFKYQSTGDDLAGKSQRKAGAGCAFSGADGFTVTAEPVTRGATGGRSFYMDQTGIIRSENGGTASGESAPLQ